MAWRWISVDALLAVHEEQLTEHGGSAGLRDRGLLESAVARPMNKAAYESPDVQALAAALCFGLVRNHPFIDGNKRTGLVASELFLDLNGWSLIASDEACVLTILSVADGTMTEDALAGWFRGKTRPN